MDQNWYVAKSNKSVTKVSHQYIAIIFKSVYLPISPDAEKLFPWLLSSVHVYMHIPSGTTIAENGTYIYFYKRICRLNVMQSNTGLRICQTHK